MHPLTIDAHTYLDILGTILLILTQVNRFIGLIIKLVALLKRRN